MKPQLLLKGSPVC